MSFDARAMADALAKTPRVARVVIAGVTGSAPREVGAAMLVWHGGQSGTIGGGALEYQAAEAARALLPHGGARLERHALGPALGQCCGGAVCLLTEVYDAVPTEPVVARRIDGPQETPLAVKRAITEARTQGRRDARLIQGWMIEVIAPPKRALWVWGAGHVGRAIVATLAPLPDFDITWIDTAAHRFPETIPSNVTHLIAANPADLVRHAPPQAEHLILTFSHAVDLELCHRLLTHGFAATGLIGSKTKWSRFRKRLDQLGHSNAQIGRICCPIGRPELGKHPQAIAVGVASALLTPATRQGAMGTKEAAQ